MFTSNKGITLIALIIAIIVLLILAAVTINMVLGDNGLFNKTKTSVAKYENAQEKENSILAGYENEISFFSSGNRDYAPINYSTQEIDTGLKWIDGKTVYQKVIDLSGLTIDLSTMGGGGRGCVLTLITNADSIVRYDGNFTLPTDEYPVSVALPSSHYGSGADFCYSSHLEIYGNNISLMFTGVNTAMFQKNGKYTISKGHLIIQYTKAPETN